MFIYFYRSHREEAVSEQSIEDENQPPGPVRVPEVADVKEVKVCTYFSQKYTRVARCGILLELWKSLDAVRLW